MMHKVKATGPLQHPWLTTSPQRSRGRRGTVMGNLTLPDPQPPAVGAREPIGNVTVNWIWTSGQNGADTALDLDGGLFAVSLSPHFRRVICHTDQRRTVESARLAFAQVQNVTVVAGSAPDYPYPPAAFDCITLTDLGGYLARRRIDGPPDFTRELGEWRRLLKPAGSLYFGVHTSRLWPYRFAWPAGSGGGRADHAVTHSLWRLRRTMVRAGFQRIRIYYAYPTHFQPVVILPRERHSVIAWRRRLNVRLSSRLVGSVATRLGLHRLHFGSCLVSASA